MDDCMDKRTAINLLDSLLGMVDDSQENDYDTALKMGIEALKADVQPVRHDPCDVCDGLEDGDTLYIYSEWDGGIEFDHIRDIHFCPKCGRRLPNFEICDKVRKE